MFIAHTVTKESKPYHEVKEVRAPDIDTAFEITCRLHPEAVEILVAQRNKYGAIVNRRKKGDRWV